MTTPKVVFAPGCFDSFEGTQEELDELIALIQGKAADGTLFEDSIPLDMEDLSDEQVEDLTVISNQDKRSIQ